MNIFFLSLCVKTCASEHCNKHMKMIVEYTQLLYTVFLMKAGEEFFTPQRMQKYKIPKIYKKTHIHHPCNVWLRESWANCYWLSRLALQVCKQYTMRYQKTHACEVHIRMFRHILSVIHAKTQDEMTLPFLVMDKSLIGTCGVLDETHTSSERYRATSWENAVIAYRKCILSKGEFTREFKTPSIPPTWMTISTTTEIYI